MMNRKYFFPGSILLASAVTLAGCQLDMPFAGQPSVGSDDRPQATNHQASGQLKLGIAWPQESGYKNQAIPYRAKEVDIRLVRVDDAGKELGPVLDLEGRAVATVTLLRPESPYSGYYPYFDASANYRLKQQTNVKVVAEAYAIKDGVRELVASASRIVDVIAGHSNYVSLDVMPPAGKAPTIQLANPMLALDQVFTLTGTNLGFESDLPMDLRIQMEGYAPENAGPFPTAPPPSYATPFGRWDGASLERTASTLKFKLPRTWNYGNYFPEYFRDKQGKVKLYLSAVIDGVPSNRVEIALPKSGHMDAAITFKDGASAPESTGKRENYSLMQSEYLPESPALGLRLTYHDGVSPSSIEVIQKYEQTYVREKGTYAYGPSFENEVPWVHYRLRPYLSGEGQLQRLGKETVKVPAFPDGIEAERFYAPSWGGGVDLWFANNIGLVKEVRFEPYGSESRTVTKVLQEYHNPANAN